MKRTLLVAAALLMALTGCSAAAEAHPTPTVTVTVTADPVVDSTGADHWKDCALLFWTAMRDEAKAMGQQNDAVTKLQHAEQAMLDGDIDTATSDNYDAAGLVSDAGDTAQAVGERLQPHTEDCNVG